MGVEYSSLLSDFYSVAKLAGAPIASDTLIVELQQAPHKPPSSLPAGKMAVYVFSWKTRCLKVGKVGPNSQARYVSQHYLPKSSGSNLARSLLAAREQLSLTEVDELNMGQWIKANTDRVNILMDISCGAPLLTLLESFLQCRLRPMFEGFASQHRS